MRALRFLSLAILSILVATSAAVYAQDEKQQEDKPKQEEPKRQDEAKPAEKPADRKDEMKAPKQEEAKPSKQEKNEQKEMDKRSGQDNHGREQAGQQAHPAGKGGHIPDDKFRSNFGRSHSFKAQRPQVVNGQPQFEYGGYSFVMVDAWPGDWAYSDDCYIDYVDGEYFLFDLLHPGVRIALFVVL